MEKILQAIVGAMLNWAKLWFQEEKAKADEWNAKSAVAMLASVKSAEKMKLEIKSVEVKVPATPAAWNAGKALLLSIIFLLLSGCIVRTVFVESKFPVIERPARPQVSGTPGWTEREIIIIDYAIHLETEIDTYNELALEHNRRNGYGD